MKTPKTNRSTRRIPALLGLIAAGSLSLCVSRAGTLYGTNITDNVSPSFTTPDSLLTVTGYSDTNLTTAANLRTGGDYFGVETGGSFKLDDSLTLDLAPGEGLSGMGFRWTRSSIYIEGFTSDPGFSTASSYISGENYANGVLSFYMGWDSGNGATFSLSNPSASDGQSLKFWVHDSASGWQATITQVGYSVVPEPSPVLLGSLGAIVLLFMRRDVWRRLHRS